MANTHKKTENQTPKLNYVDTKSINGHLIKVYKIDTDHPTHDLIKQMDTNNYISCFNGVYWFKPMDIYKSGLNMWDIEAELQDKYKIMCY